MAQRPHWLPDGLGVHASAVVRAIDIDTDSLLELIVLALAEDLDGGVDVTTVATVPNAQESVLELVARKDGVVAGVAVAVAVFDLVSSGSIEFEIHAVDGARVTAGTTIATFRGNTLELLTGERTALNFISHLSGVATATAEWVSLLSGTKAKVRDTRKTTPGMRRLEKWAVRLGGGENHRMSLSDAALIKDNHIVAAGGVVEAFQAVQHRFPDLDIEVEVDSLEQLHAVVEAGADCVLLDNFTPDQMREAVDWTAGRAKLEASGGLTVESAKAVAATGVDFVAVGAITHSAPVLDIGADLRAI